MAFDRNSNGYTFAFATIMVVVVGAVLSIAAMSLKPKQVDNIRKEKMRDILTTIEVMSKSDDMDKAPELFQKYIVDQIVLDYNGNVKKGVEAFNVDVKKEYKSLPPEKRNYPLFIAEKDGKKYYIIPMVGTGLWGPIWGYLALEEDMTTVYGASFDHKTETPGLGAEIAQKPFQEQFKGKKIFDENGNFKPIKVIKGGAEPGDLHGVDAITGGTITSTGVSEMIERTLKTYVPYFKKQLNV
ncbi:MAG: NADH:ubiquinone reductase (Na(+)-transporting) subunit C [Bacteroidetes bacterium]|nr:MAG: NADH:ubiquinone reductase (Na(+)-transporting) subunit C [Bacteroidota bacterium]